MLNHDHSVAGNRTWTSVRPRGGISPPVRSCFSLGVVPSSAFLLSIRPSTSHSAPPCTPMPSSFLEEVRQDSRPTTRGNPTGGSWCDLVTRWDSSAASLGSCTLTSSTSTVKFQGNKRCQNRPTSMMSADAYESTREVYENSKGMALSNDSLHGTRNSKETRLQPHLEATSGNRSQDLSGSGLSSAKRALARSQELLTVDFVVSSDLRKNLTCPVACLLVFGGKTRNQAEMGRTLDIWRCDIDPGKLNLKSVASV